MHISLIVQAGSVVLKFLEQYYILYDGDSRQPLLDAYHEDAMMSMAAVGSFEQLKAYILESRNLTRISDNRQHKLLKRGRLQVSHRQELTSGYFSIINVVADL